MTNFQEQLEQLKNGEIDSITVTKEDFYTLREIIIEHPNFKQFKGIAQQGGNVVYVFDEQGRN